jgi:hypothetical protein
MGLAMLVLFGALPLQWFLVPGLPAGPERLHIVAMVVFAAVVFARHRARAWSPVVSLAMPFLAAYATTVAIWAASAVYNGESLRQPLQEVMQIGVFVAVGAMVYRAALHPESEVLPYCRWAALVSVTTLVVALSISMSTNGVDAVAVFQQAISRAEPAILQHGLFRNAFVGFGFDEDTVSGNIRHEVYSALLVSMCVSAAAVRMRPFRSAAALRLYRASMVLGAVLIVLSLSRSVMLAAALWPALAAWRSVARRRVTGAHMSVLVAGSIGTAIAFMTGFGTVLWVRFTEDTSSYEGRERQVQEALSDIPLTLSTGTGTSQEVTSHFFVLDSFLRGGLLGGLAAVAATAVLLYAFAKLAVRLPSAPSWMLPVTACLALPVVRIFTSGSGVLPPTQWVALGVVAGFLAYQRTSAQRAAYPRTGPSTSPPSGRTIRTSGE